MIDRVHRPLRNFLGLSIISFLIIIGAGCSSSDVGRTYSTTTSTSIALNNQNYRMVKAGAHGTSYGFRLLGIIPMGSPHFAAARQDLYESIPEPLTGKAVALANQMEDRSLMYFILFSIPKLTITADVIEFTDSPAF